MKLVTWNINHRASRKKIPLAMGKALTSLSPDVIVLTEYVPGPSHEEFIKELAICGFPHVLMSQHTPKQNHVFIASRGAILPGAIKGPEIAPSVPSNVLHVRVPSYNIEVLGVRVPDYSRDAATRHACWDWLEATASRVGRRPFVILGDLNVDPSNPPSKCGDRIGKIVEAGWQLAAPATGYSYMPLMGGRGKRLDHAFVSRHFTILDAKYIWESNGHMFAGKRSGAMSDHAALYIDIESV